DTDLPEAVTADGAGAPFSASSWRMRASCRSINWRIRRASSGLDCVCVVCSAVGVCVRAAALNAKHNGKHIKSAISLLNILIAPTPVMRGALAEGRDGIRPRKIHRLLFRL